MKRVTVADRFNAVYKEIVNDNKISDYLSNLQEREYLDNYLPELNLAVTEFLAMMMAAKNNVKVDFKENKNGVLLDCNYEDIKRHVVFNFEGKIISDNSYQLSEKSK